MDHSGTSDEYMAVLQLADQAIERAEGELLRQNYHNASNILLETAGSLPNEQRYDEVVHQIEIRFKQIVTDIRGTSLL